MDTGLELPLFVEASENPGLPERGTYVRNDISNMHPYESFRERPDGLRTATVEHDYQLEKFLDEVTRRLVSELGTRWPDGNAKDLAQISGFVTKTFLKELERNNYVFSATESQMSAKWGLPKSWIRDLGHSQTDLAGNSTFFLRAVPMPQAQWDLRKELVMREALLHKYSPGTKAEAGLLASGTVEKVEWNNWSDRYWGRDVRDGQGQNRLGVLTMEIRRDKIREMSLSSNVANRDVAAKQISYRVSVVPASHPECLRIGRGAFKALESGHQLADFRDILEERLGAHQRGMRDHDTQQAMTSALRLAKEEGGLIIGYDGTDEMLCAEHVAHLIDSRAAELGRPCERVLVASEDGVGFDRSGQRERVR